MLCLLCGAEKLGAGALAKVCQEEKEKGRISSSVNLAQMIKNTRNQDNISPPDKEQLTRRSLRSELSDFGSISIRTFPHRAAFSAEGGVLILYDCKGIQRGDVRKSHSDLC